MDVLGNDLGDPQITKRSAGHLKRSRRGILPGFGTGSNEIRHSIDAHATLLGHVGGLCHPTGLPYHDATDKRSTTTYGGHCTDDVATDGVGVEGSSDETIVESTGTVAPSTSDEVVPVLSGTEKRLAAARTLVKELERQEAEQKREKARRAAEREAEADARLANSSGSLRCARRWASWCDAPRKTMPPTAGDRQGPGHEICSRPGLLAVRKDGHAQGPQRRSGRHEPITVRTREQSGILHGPAQGQDRLANVVISCSPYHQSQVCRSRSVET